MYKKILDIIVVISIVSLGCVLANKTQQNTSQIEENHKLITKQTEILQNREAIFKAILEDSKNQTTILEKLKLELKGIKFNKETDK
jgi:hypothetical protein